MRANKEYGKQCAVSHPHHHHHHHHHHPSNNNTIQEAEQYKGSMQNNFQSHP